MKSIKKLVFVLFGALVVSCSPDDVQDRPVIEGVGSPVLSAPESETAYELLPEDMTQQAERFVWSAADYNGAVAVNYSLEMDVTGGDFSDPQVLGGTTGALQLSVSVETLNNACLALDATPYVASQFDVRVVSSASGFDMMASNKATITITPFTTDLPRIAVPGNHQGWNPPTAPTLAASAFGEADYEGYVWLDGGHKFVAPDSAGAFNWGNTDWGDDGTFSGALVETGETDCTAPAGYYRVKANTDTLLYEEVMTTWGIIGSATPTGWDSDTNMTYNSTTKKWEIIITLIDGKIKFRYNDTWNVDDAQWNLGLFDSTKTGQNYGGENMSYGGGDITVTAGTYLVELDLSSPRDYKYTLTPQ